MLTRNGWHWMECGCMWYWYSVEGLHGHAACDASSDRYHTIQSNERNETHHCRSGTWLGIHLLIFSRHASEGACLKFVLDHCCCCAVLWICLVRVREGWRRLLCVCVWFSNLCWRRLDLRAESWNQHTTGTTDQKTHVRRHDQHLCTNFEKVSVITTIAAILNSSQ